MPHQVGNQGAPPPPNPHQQINDRAGSLPPDFIQDHPVTALHLLFSRLPQDQFKQMATGLSSIYPWLKANNGPNGAFLTPRAVATSITDPQVQQATHGILDVLQHAAEETAQSQETGIRGPAPRGGAVLTTGRPARTTYSKEVGGVVIEADGIGKTITIPTHDTNDPSYLAAVQTIHQLYPDWTVKTVSTNDTWNAINGAISFIGSSLDKPFQLADVATRGLPGPLHMLNTGIKGAETGVNTAFGRAVDLASGAVEETYHIPEQFIENTLGGQHGSYTLPTQYWWPKQPGTALGNAVTTGLGMKPTDPNTQTVGAAADLIGQFIIGKFAGEYGRGVKGGRTTVTTTGEAPPSVHSAVERAAFDLTNTPINQWGSTKTGVTFARSIDAAKAKYGAKAGAVMQKRFGDDIVTKTFANIVDNSPTGKEAVQAFTDLASNTDPRLMGKLIDRQGQIESRLTDIGKEQGNAVRSKVDDKIAAIENRIQGAPPEEAARLEAELADIRSKAPPRTSAERLRELQQEQAQLRLEQRSIRATLAKPANGWEPVRKLPTRATMLKVATQESPLGAFLHMLYEPPTRWAPHLSRVFDLLGHTTIYNPFKLDAPVEVHRENIGTLRTWLTGAGVKGPELDGLVSQYLNMTGDADFNRFMNAVGDTIEKHGSYLAADERLGMSTIFRNTDLETRRRSQIEDERGPAGSEPGRQAVLVDGSGNQLPSMTSEMINDFSLPPVEELRRARSLTRQMIRNGQKLGLHTDDAFRTLQTVNRAVTNVFKFAILVPRVIGQALILRVQGEQALRTKLSGLPIFSKDKLAKWDLLSNAKGRVMVESTQGALDARVVDYLQSHEQGYVGVGTPTVRQLPDGRWQANVSMVRRDVATMQKFRPSSYTENTGLLDFSSDPESNGNMLRWIERATDDGNGHLDDLAASIILDRINHRFTSPEMRKLAELQGNTVAWEKWLKENPIGQQALENMQENIQRGGVSIQEWGKRSFKAMQQYTGHDERLLDAVATSRWSRVNPAGVREAADQGKHMVTHEDASRYDQLKEDLVGNRDALDSALNANDSGLISALTAERTGIIDQMSLIERKLPEQDFTQVGLGPTTTTPTNIGARTIPLGDRLRLIGELKQAYEDKTFKPPVRVNGELRNDLITRLEGAKRQKRFFADAQRWGMALLEKEDVTRRGMYTKVASDEYQRLRNLGYSDKDAFAYAKAHGARVTRDVMYDLTERSSLQRATKNIFWFLPAVQELLTTWFIKLPAKSYWPVGAASMYTQAHAIMGLLRLSGAVQKNSAGQDVIRVPGLGDLLGKITGSKIPDEVYGYPGGLNIAAGGLPSFSTQVSLMIEAANKLDPNSKAISSLHEFVHKYSPAITVGPAVLNDAYEGITGKAPPWEIFSHGYQQQIVNLGMEKAMQQARIALGPPPDPNKYGTAPKDQQQFTQDMSKYNSELVSKARSTYRGWQLLTAFGAVSSPMSLHITDQYREDWNKFYTQTLGKDYQSQNYSKGQRDILNFLDEHPGAFGYTVARTHVTGEKPQDPAYTKGSQAAYYQSLYDGFLKSYGPKDFATWMAGMESRRQYLGQQSQALDAAGSTWQQQLTNGYQRGQAFDKNRYEWQKYLAWNHDPGPGGGRSFADMWGDREAIFERIGVKGHPYQDYAVQQQIQTMDLLHELSPKLEAGGIPGGDIKAITGQLAKVFDGTSAKSTPYSAQGKAIANYMTNTYIPYVTHIHDLFTQAANLSDRGINPGPVYDQIRQYEEQQSKLAKANGQPDPQAVTWGNKSPEEQRLSKVKYASEPVGWLTSFQRTQAGYDSKFKVKPGVVNGFFTYQAHFDDWLKKWEQANRVSPNSAYYDTLQTWRTNWLTSQAKAHDKTGQLSKLFSLAEGTPVDRLNALGYGQGIPSFGQLVQASDQISSQITKDGLSPSGNSSEAVYYRSWFHSIVEKTLSTDPQLSGLLQELSTTTPTKYGYMQGNPLYDALFFNARPVTIYPMTQPWSQEKLLGGGSGPQSVAKWLQTYQNGKIPLGAMSSIGGGFELQPAAAQGFEAAVAAAKKQGIDLLGNVTSAYRSYAEQSSLYTGGNSYPVAAPGTSNHGYGLAIDMAPGSPGWQWMTTHGIQYGWDWTGAQIGDLPHFTFRGAPGI